MPAAGDAAIAGVYEHPTREAPDASTPELHADVAAGALADAGLTPDDVDGYATAGTPGWIMSMADYLGLSDLAWYDFTDSGGSAYVSHVGHAAAAIRAGTCEVVLVTLAGRPRSEARQPRGERPEDAFEGVFGVSTVAAYALAARRHQHEFGTTRAQLAEVRVAAAAHAQHNPDAMYREPVTVEDVLDSRPIAEPLHLLDCCVVSDGGGAVVVVSPERAAGLDRACPVVLGHGEAIGGTDGGDVDLTTTTAVDSGARAYAAAGVEPADVDYASIYDSFTITVLEAVEDLGFCAKGEGGAFVEDGGLVAPDGDLPYNTDGGGLCNNHPGNRGGMTKIIEAVRQLRGEANDPVQVPDCEVALAHGTGGSLGTRHSSSTLVLGADR